jgi:hexosaminidase
MPAPAQIQWEEGRLVLESSFTLASEGATDPRIGAALVRTLARLRARTHLPLELRQGGNARLVVAARGPGKPVQEVGEDESYSLQVDPKGARLAAPNPLGILRGLETFLQLVQSDAGGAFVPAVRIEDAPRFPWRGLLLDPSRRFEGVEVTKRTLDAMAAVKLNVLHWHLSDDQGFRVESRVFPKLQGRGSDGLFFTQDEIRMIVQYARDRGIRVVPEFDMPGHSTTWLLGYPELGSGGPVDPVRAWGIFDAVLDPTREEVLSFIDRFLGEMGGLFPDLYVHMGGDEVTPRAWNANPGILDFMYHHRLADADDLQAYFNGRVNQILARHGKRMVGWDEILRPELPKDIVVQSWRGGEALARAANMGYDTMLSNDYYLDLMMPASLHYLNDPVPPGVQEDARSHVLGGEACMWGEFVDPETIDSRLWPRGAAVAERLWSPASVQDVEDMYRRLEIESVRLDEVGALHRKHYLPMLERIAGGRRPECLRVLADLVEPVKRYRRGELRSYTSATPLDRLVDAARPESMQARAVAKDVRGFVGGDEEAGGRLREAFSRWRGNHAVLDPILEASPLGAEARSLSRGLSEVGGLGLQALDAVSTGAPLPGDAARDAEGILTSAGKAQAEVELAVVPSVARLVLAATRVRELRALPPAERNAFLDALVPGAAPPPP